MKARRRVGCKAGSGQIWRPDVGWVARLQRKRTSTMLSARQRKVRGDQMVQSRLVEGEEVVDKAPTSD